MEPIAYAVIDGNGLIVNTILWDGNSGWTPPDGMTTQPIGDLPVGIGWSYINGEFIPPAEPEVPHEDLVAQAAQQKANLMAEASQQVSVLQDAVDLDMATDEEKAMLLVWKKYRVLLNRVDPNLAPDIDWPAHP